MDSKIQNLEIKKYYKEFQLYYQLLTRQILNIKLKYKDIELPNEFLKEKDLSIIFILFSYCKKNIYNQNIGNIDENNNIEKEKNNFLKNFIENSFSDYKYNLLYFWQCYLIISLIQEIKLFLMSKENNEFDYNTKNINRLLYLFEKNKDIIISVYKKNKLSIKQIINLLNMYIIWIEENDFNLIKGKIICDKYIKIKIYYLLKIFFCLLKNIFQIELKSKNEENIKQLFEYLEKFISFKNLCNIDICPIVLNQVSLHSLVLSILQNIELELYKKYKIILINFCKNFLNNNFNKSGILEKIINNIKNSFLNLSIIKKDKNSKKYINNDLLIQNFYFELLMALYNEFSSDLNYRKFFNFNGIDSKMSFKLNNCSLVNTLIIFSFCLKSDHANILTDRGAYPLFTIYDESENKNLFIFYIKQNLKLKKYNLYFKVQGNNTHITVNDFKYRKEKDKSSKKLRISIENNKIYYIALQLNLKTITVFLNRGLKEIELKNNLSDKKDNIFQIGYDKVNQNYFKGLFGPFFILRNQEIKKNWNKIFGLREEYSELIYHLSKNSIYNFDIIENFKYNFKNREQLDNINPNYIKEYKNKLECLLYLTPSIIESYSDINESSYDNYDKYFLPLIPDICEKQKYYNISELNNSIINKENIYMNFLMGNGLYFICLQYEYLYQLLMNILKNAEEKEDYNDILIENKEIINNILISSIKILINNNNYILNYYEIFKITFLNLFNCIKSFNKCNKNILSDEVIKNIGELVVAYINNFFDIKEENKDINERDKNKILEFRDGLIDFLLSSELYDNANLSIIKYNFTLLFSLKKNEKDSIFLSNKTLLRKILNFIELLENKNKNKKEKLIDEKNEIKNNESERIIQKIFELLKEYFIIIKSSENSQILFSELLHYCLSNLKNNYNLIYKYFNLIYELIGNEYYFENNEIQILIDYIYELIKNNNNEINENNIINDKDENQNKINDELVLIVLKILIDLIFVNKQDKEIKKNIRNLIQFIIFSNELLNGICKEILNIFDFLFNRTKKEEGKIFKLYMNLTERNISKVYSGLFKFIITTLNSIINNEDIKQNNTIKKTNEVLSLLLNINKKLRQEFQNEVKNEDLYICLLIYAKFLYKIVLTEEIFNSFSLLNIDIFICNLCDFVYLCNEAFLLNTNILINIKINKKIFEKTFIEIILDIYINILLEDKYEKSHKLLYESIKTIFENIAIGKNIYTIFYYNDYLVNLFTKKKNNDQKIKNEINNINKILLLENYTKFEMSFTTFFLLKLASYLEYLSNNFIKNEDTLKKFLENLIEKLIVEHRDLYKLKNDIFSKISNNRYYNELKDLIISDMFGKKNEKKNDETIFLKFKDFFHKKLSLLYNPISEEITSGNCNTKDYSKKILLEKRNKSQAYDDNNIINNNFASKSHHGSLYSKKKSSSNIPFNQKPRKSADNSLNLNPSLTFKENNNKIINSSAKSMKNLNIDKLSNIEENNEISLDENKEKSNNALLKEEKSEKEVKDDEEHINIESKTIIDLDEHLPLKTKGKIKQMNLSDYVGSIYFFEDIDIKYIKNYKKFLMNDIFSIYFIDAFYHNELFKKMKIFYLNKYDEATIGTKVMAFPSIYKNFNNGLEPRLFLKQHNYFFESKYFPISHPYFVDYLKEHNLQNKSINLIPKSLPNYIFNNKNQSNCFKIDAELVKIETEYFGQIFIFNFIRSEEKFLLFQEKEYIPSEDKEDFFDNKDNYKYLFSLTFSTDREKRRQKKNDFLKKRKEKTIIIFFSEIEEIIERRFFLMWQGFEIFLKNGKSYLFNLYSVENKNEIMNFFKNEEKLKNLVHTKDFLVQAKQISKEWKKYHISTYEYLLLVNKYGSRTFNNNEQYPLFPWIFIRDYSKLKEINEANFNDELLKKYFNNKGENIIIDKKTKELFSLLRKTKFPICIQTIEKQNEIIDKYNQEDGKFKYHLGIHYATSSYIYYYLMRQEPYTDLLIKLQNYQQENPNRMFIGINESIHLLENSKDPRELIPELYSHIEYLLNLNCVFFGMKSNDKIVDDCLIYFFDGKKNSNPFYQYITFVIEQRKLLNSKILSITINDWIDNVFGYNQIPKNPKVRENSCNIFKKSSYEQELNLQNKLDKYLNKYKNKEETKESALKKIMTKIDLIMNFGQTPYQIFKEKHLKRKINELYIENSEEVNKKEEVGKIGGEDKFDEFENVVTIIKTQNNEKEIRDKYNYVYFEINPNINKLFMISEEDEKRCINILNINLDTKNDNKSFFSEHDCVQIPYFLSNDKILKECLYYIHKFKYAFSSFDNYEENESYHNIDTKQIFLTHGHQLIENIKNLEKNKNFSKSVSKKHEINENIYFKFITCRYIDNSFKIHRFLKNKISNKKSIYKPISYICEDFVCSCCVISFCQFLIGLKNGKLIQFYIEPKESIIDINSSEFFTIKMEKYIQAHIGKINVIEINKRLGIIITCGDDNYILIRKLYDFELLSPIKVKNKYIITMAKVSPLNFLYIICYNKEKEKSIILGYTLTGLQFAKSEYGFYDNIDFTPKGNIVTLKNRKELCILGGNDLDGININNKDSNEDFDIKKNKVKDSIWMKYDYFTNKENNYSKIITYFKIENRKLIAKLDVSQNIYFD